MSTGGALPQIAAPLFQAVLGASINPETPSTSTGARTSPYFPNQPVGRDTLDTRFPPTNGNIALSKLEIAKGNAEWRLDFENWQKFVLEVHPAVGDRRLGHTVGLVQTLLSSTRKITYAGGGALFIPGGQPPPNEPENLRGPWLDADQTTEEGRPWYRNTCEGKVMRAGQIETLVMEDNPTFIVPTIVYDKAKKPHALQHIFVEEVFLISLYDADFENLKFEVVGSYAEPLPPVIKQWTWQYKYDVTVTMTPTGNLDYKIVPPTPVTTIATPVTTPNQHIPTDGNVANDLPPWFKFEDPTWTRYLD